MNPDDEKACLQLCINYAHFIDAADFKNFSQLFTEDGLLELPARRMESRRAIFETLSQRSTATVTLHFCTGTKIHSRGVDEATGSTYAMIFRHDADAEPATLPVAMALPLSTGIYDDEFVRTQEGWLFRSRRMRAFFRKQ